MMYPGESRASRAGRPGLAVLLVLALAASSHAQPGLVENDKARLIEATASPTPLIFGETLSRLATVVAVRATDGLGAQDSSSQQADTTRFDAELTWELFDSSGSAVVATAKGRQAIVPPFTLLTLPADPTLATTATGVETQVFIRVTPVASFDGHDASSALIAAGHHPYRVRAQVVRYKQVGSRTDSKVIGVSRDLTGSLLAAPRPAPPSVDPFPRVSKLDRLAAS